MTLSHPLGFTEIPERPNQAPTISNLTKDTVTLSWTRAPIEDAAYIVESFTDNNWESCAETVDLECCVKDLNASVQHEFRLRVKNEWGTSEPSPTVKVPIRAGKVSTVNSS